MPLDQYIAHRVNNIEESRRNVTRNHEKMEQEHKGINTHDIDSSPRRSKSCVKIRLWCLRVCHAKKRCSERVLKKPTRRILERIKARSKECEKHDDTVAVAGVSTTPHRESINHRDAPKKSERNNRKQNEAVEVDKDVSKVEKNEKRKKEEKKKKVMIEEETDRRERRKREEHIPYPVDTRLVARDDDLAVEDQVPVKPSLIADLEKSCCYLCVRNTLAIAAAVSRPECDKCIQVSANKFHRKTFSKLDKSCSPVLLVRTVQSFVKVKTRETGTLCPGTSAVPLLPGETRPRAKKRKKFTLFPGLTRTKCPAGRYAACQTDKSTARHDDNAKKPEPKCCRDKNV